LLRFQILPNAKKAEERLKEMNALLILKTTRSSNAELSLANTELVSKRTKEKRAAELINATMSLSSK
jgi:hypothetical protein